MITEFSSKNIDNLNTKDRYLILDISMNVISFKMNVEDIVNNALINRFVTKAEQQFLNQALLYKDSLKEHERILIERVFYGIRHGLLQIVESK